MVGKRFVWQKGRALNIACRYSNPFALAFIPSQDRLTVQVKSRASPCVYIQTLPAQNTLQGEVHALHTRHLEH